MQISNTCVTSGVVPLQFTTFVTCSDPTLRVFVIVESGPAPPAAGTARVAPSSPVTVHADFTNGDALFSATL